MPDVWQSPRSSPRSGKPAAWRRGAVRWCGTKRITLEKGCMNPTKMAEEPMFPTHSVLTHLMESRMP